MVKYFWEPVEDLLKDGLEELGRQSFDELMSDEKAYKYCPNWDRYRELEKQNSLRWISVRDDDKLVGYASVLMHTSMTDSTLIMGVIQDLFLHPDYRKGFAGIEFVKTIENQLRDLGFGEIIISDRGNRGAIYNRMGYNMSEKIWSKSLRGAA